MCKAKEECPGRQAINSTVTMNITYDDAAVVLEVPVLRCLTCGNHWSTPDMAKPAELAAINGLLAIGTQDPAFFTAARTALGITRTEMAKMFHATAEQMDLYVAFGIVMPEWWGALAFRALIARQQYPRHAACDVRRLRSDTLAN
jgi:hypothetical protein